MRNLSWKHLVCCTLLAAAAGGCKNVLRPAAPDPTPTPGSKPTKPVFISTDYVTHFSTVLPGTYRVAQVISGDTVTVQSVTTATVGTSTAVGTTTTAGTTNTAGTSTVGKTSVGKPAKTQIVYGTPEKVHLAGIVAPAPGQPGWQGSAQTVTNWTLLNKLNPSLVSVEVDPRFVYFTGGSRNVQIFFKGTTKLSSGIIYDLNRMMVRSGWALVDLHSATSIPLQPWLNDQEYARISKLGLWKTPVTLPWVYKTLEVPAPTPTPIPTPTPLPGAKRAKPPLGVPSARAPQAVPPPAVAAPGMPPLGARPAGAPPFGGGGRRRRMGGAPGGPGMGAPGGPGMGGPGMGGGRRFRMRGAGRMGAPGQPPGGPGGGMPAGAPPPPAP